MGTLVYAPGVEVLIDSWKRGTIDVTPDLVNGRMQLVAGRPHAFSFAILNRGRRYDRLFMPNDRIVVRMKRLRWLQVFAGYLDSTPIFSVYPRTVNLSATCTLKRLQFRYWDPATIAAEQLLHQDDDANNTDVDGGMKGKLVRLLTEVADWPRDHIHIAEVPGKWFENIADLYDTLGDRIQSNMASVGSGATIAGQDSNPGATQVVGVNSYTGMIPSSSGRANMFGGPNGGAYGPFELTSEPGVIEDSQRAQYGGPFYCAMRWPYLNDNGERPARLSPAGTSAEVSAARRWWKNRKILVTNPGNGKQVVVRAADWGPAKWTTFTIDMSRSAHEAIGTQVGDTVNIGFADDDALLGISVAPSALANSFATGSFGAPAPETAHGGGSTPTTGQTENVGLPPKKPEGTTRLGGSDFAWGGYSNGKIPEDKMATITTPNGQHFQLHPLAAAAYEQMRDAAAKDGVPLNMTGSYRSYAQQVATKAAKPKLAAEPGTSIHGWGFAIDFTNLGGYSGAYYTWLQKNGHKYGWVNPPWAVQGGSKEESWHWEWWAAVGLAPTPDNLQPAVTGAWRVGDPLTNTAQWETSIPGDVLEASILSGPRALMNDEPFLKTVEVLFGASMRSFCTAPNGDLIGWFPDYFGQYGTAGKLIIQDIELLDFTVDWIDQFLKTHMFTSGASSGISSGSVPGGEDAASLLQKYATTGIATVEFPEIMQALFGVTPENDPYHYLDAAVFLQKFGARPDYQPMSLISNPRAVFWYALFLFQKNWAEQFHAPIPTTFMPEAWPGMLVQIPTIRGERIGFQAYVEAVTHTFDFSDGAGFQTTLSTVAPSIVKDGKASPLVLVGD